jgi:hypothetical protein
VDWHPLRWRRRVIDGPEWSDVDDVGRMCGHSEGGLMPHPLSWRRRGSSVVCTPRAPLMEARTQGLNIVVACRIGAIRGFLCLEVLVGVR